MNRPTSLAALAASTALIVSLLLVLQPRLTQGLTGVNDPVPGQIFQVSVDMDTTGNPPGSGGLLSSIQSNASVPVGSTYDIDVIVDEVDPSDGMAGFGFNLKFDPTVVKINSENSSFILSPDIIFSQPLPCAGSCPTAGNWRADEGRIGANVNGEGVLLRLTLECLANGVSALDLADDIEGDGIPTLLGPVGEPLPVLSALDGEIACGSPPPTGTLTVNKDFSDNNTGPVEVVVSCDNGATPDHPFSKTVTEATPVDFTISLPAGPATCDVVEDPAPAGYSEDNSGCQNVAVSSGSTPSCTIINTLIPPTATPTPTPTPSPTPTPTPTPSPTPTATPTPFTPTYTQTIDDVAPDDPSVVPASDTCEVGVPCKTYYHLSIPDGQPGGTSSYPGIGPQVILPDSYASVFGDAAIPDGAIVGRNWGQTRAGAVGSCASGSIFPFDEVVYEGTTVHATTTGDPSDIASFDRWPIQLDGVVTSVTTSHPGSTLNLRWVLPAGLWNVLVFNLVGGETLFLAVGGDPAGPPQYQECGPYDSNFLILGLTKDNPATAADEGGVPLSTCVAPGTSSFELTIDRNDTPPGDITTLFDTTSCTSNTPTGSSVDVPLLGGTSNLGGVDVSFDQVNTEGSTSATGSTSGPPPPTGFQVIGLGGESTYYDINTTADYTGPVTLCVHYDDSGLSAAEESALKLMQFDGTTFVDRTTTLNTATNIICASAPSFSTWAVMIAPPDTDGDGVFDMDDACLNTPGLAERQGCPVGDENLVELHVVDQAKTGFCPSGARSCKLPIGGAEIRVFDRDILNGLTINSGTVTLTKNPKGSLYDDIFEAVEAEVAEVGACTTDASGICTAGEESIGDYLVIVKASGDLGTAYSGKPKSPGDFVDTDGDLAGDLASKDFQFIVVFRKDGSVQLGGGSKTVVSGSYLEIIYPDEAVWESAANGYVYPFIFTSDSTWDVNVCGQVPAGYDIVGVYDAEGILVTTTDCVQTLIAGETKVLAFDVMEVGSPEPVLEAVLIVRHEGEVTQVDIEVPGVRTYEETSPVQLPETGGEPGGAPVWPALATLAGVIAILFAGAVVWRRRRA